MQSFDSFALAVELFVIVFSLLCWLVTPADSSVPSVDNSQQINFIDNPGDTRFSLTPEMEAEFYALLDIETVKNWGQYLGDQMISERGDTVSCPLVHYLLTTGIYESVDIATAKTAWFWTVHEIEACTDEQLSDLDAVEKHCLDLPAWAATAIPFFDEILEHRAITGSDVVRILNDINNVSDPRSSAADLQSLAETLDALTIAQTRKVASGLRKLAVLSPETKLTGSGKGKAYLAALIKDKMPACQAIIASTITAVLAETRA